MEEMEEGVSKEEKFEEQLGSILQQQKNDTYQSEEENEEESNEKKENINKKILENTAQKKNLGYYIHRYSIKISMAALFLGVVIYYVYMYGDKELDEFCKWFGENGHKLCRK
jgi:hypothetical protein